MSGGAAHGVLPRKGTCALARKLTDRGARQRQKQRPGTSIRDRAPRAAHHAGACQQAARNWPSVQGQQTGQAPLTRKSRLGLGCALPNTRTQAAL